MWVLVRDSSRLIGENERHLLFLILNLLKYKVDLIIV